MRADRIPGESAAPAARPAMAECPMLPSDLDRPAELTLWPGSAPARVAATRSFPTLRAALAAAVAAIDAEDANPWIITEGGDILAPGWIRSNSAGTRVQ